jgi:hypothetical protein
METFAEIDIRMPWGYLHQYQVKKNPPEGTKVQFRYVDFLVAQLPAYYLIRFVPLHRSIAVTAFLHGKGMRLHAVRA